MVAANQSTMLHSMTSAFCLAAVPEVNIFFPVLLTLLWLSAKLLAF